MEIGSPMAAMYFLGQPDHNASHPYVCTICMVILRSIYSHVLGTDCIRRQSRRL
ncbi:hypothetical protein B0H17DRAFT_929598 [Mycena rosella]|uniref:Uncharacterized protein n=1 Tax=Mycena rosella TaxID=1033263 RepID=A0AAD7DR89_MYCRO|nr:hypothetical protein B0H17DRAFT_929598 [Mycena rosella]